MKVYRIILAASLVLPSGALLAQETTDQAGTDKPVTYEKAFGGHRFCIDDEPVSRRTLKSFISTNPDSLEAFNKSNGAHTGSMILAYAGGIAVGSALGAGASGEEEVNTGVVGAGLAMIGAALFLGKRSEKHVIRSIDIFNNAKVSMTQDSSHFRKVSSSLFLTPDKVGFSLSF